MNKNIKVFTLVLSLSSTLVCMATDDLSKMYDMPDASQILEKDQMAKAQKFTMPKSCNLEDKEAIARGKYLFHNISSEKAVAGEIPKGLKQPKKGEVKQYGNCIACHNIEGAVDGGNLGYDLTAYKATYLGSEGRDSQFLYQKIADPRIDNPQTSMTVNLTTKLFTEEEICDMTAYVISPK